MPRPIAAFAIALAASVLAACTHAPADHDVQARIARVLDETPLVDGHNDLMIHYHACRDGCPRGPDGYDIGTRTSGHTDIPRWRAGRLGAQLLNSGWTDDDAPTLDGTLEGFEFARALVALHASDLVLARTSAEIRQAHANGRIAMVLSLETPERLGTDEATVRRLAEAGLRADILAYEGPTAYADGHAGPMEHGGLSPLGRKMVGWMQANGILVDLSHASADTARDVLDIARAPVIFSHSNAAALCGVSRNVPDDVLRRMRANGGIVMATFVPEFTDKAFDDWWNRGDAAWKGLLQRFGGDRARANPEMDRWERENPPPVVALAEVADHIEHIRDVAGIDHVGLGGDFDGIDYTIEGLGDVSTYPRLFEELARRGWSDADLKKLAGENFLRVLDAADAASARLKGSARDRRRTR
ncbi:MAG: dipeptidase [Thermomonas sp.]